MTTEKVKLFVKSVRYDKDSPWREAGFTLSPTVERPDIESVEEIQKLRNRDNGVVVYLFDTDKEARAFCLGLTAAGEDEAMAAYGKTNTGCYGVVREINNYEYWREIAEEDPLSFLVIDNRW